MSTSNKIKGNILFYVLLSVIVGVGVNWGTSALLATLAFLLGLYAYFNLLLNVAYSIKDKVYKENRLKLIVYAVISILVFALSIKFYGVAFALKAFFLALILFVVQLFFIVKG